MNKNLATILKRERERERMNIYSGYILDIYIEIQEAFLIEFFLIFYNLNIKLNLIFYMHLKYLKAD